MNGHARGRARVAILISGAGSNMAALADAMAATDHPGRPVLVLANRPGAGGLDLARRRGIAAQAIDHHAFGGDRAAFEAQMQRALVAAGAEWVCLAGFMRVLTPDFVAAWQGRMLNIHPSLLPRHPGLDTHRRALAAGDAEHGCTVHQVTAALDAGPVLGQARLPVRPGDTPERLAARVQALEHRLYPRVLAAQLCGQPGRIELA